MAAAISGAVWGTSAEEALGGGMLDTVANMAKAAELPALLGAEVGDVGDVMAGMPGVGERGKVELLGAALGVGEGTLPLDFGEGLKEHDPTSVDAFDNVERPLGRGGGVVEPGEGGFVIARDGWEVFSEGFADAEEGGHMRVGDVMDDLANGPAAFAVGSVDFRSTEMTKRLAQEFGHLSQSVDGVAAILGQNGVGRDKRTDGIAGIKRGFQGLWSFIGGGRQLRHRLVGSVERLGLRWIKLIVAPAGTEFMDYTVWKRLRCVV